jgi:hypothetical protein
MPTDPREYEPEGAEIYRSAENVAKVKLTANIPLTLTFDPGETSLMPGDFFTMESPSVIGEYQVMIAEYSLDSVIITARAVQAPWNSGPRAKP